MQKTSDIILDMFKENKGTIEIVTLQGKKHDFKLSKNGLYIESQTALRN